MNPRALFMNIHCRPLAALVLSCFLTAADVQPAPVSFGQRPEVQAFIQGMVQRHGFEEAALRNLMDQVYPGPEAIALVAPPVVPVRRSWKVYRSRFVEPLRIKAGVAFWREHRTALARAEKAYGVPAEVIAGILGVETLYGRNMGRFPVLETLLTLAFNYPDSPRKATRSAMFLNELEEYLLWCRESGQDPLALTGSYTGAMGLPQFLPSSVRAHAVDFDGDGRIDLRNSAEDAIGSVARFLKDQGWEKGRPIYWPVTASERGQAFLAEKADGDPERRWRVGDLLEEGIVPAQARGAARLRAFRRTERETRVILVDLPSPDMSTDYVLGLTNFYVLTRYNRSYFYAMAVVDLGRAVKAKAGRH